LELFLVSGERENIRQKTKTISKSGKSAEATLHSPNFAVVAFSSGYSYFLRCCAPAKYCMTLIAASGNNSYLFFLRNTTLRKPVDGSTRRSRAGLARPGKCHVRKGVEIYFVNPIFSFLIFLFPFYLQYTLCSEQAHFERGILFTWSEAQSRERKNTQKAKRRAGNGKKYIYFACYQLLYDFFAEPTRGLLF